MHPPSTNPKDYRPEPRGAKTVEELLAEPIPPPPDSPPARRLEVRVTNCYARTVGIARGPVDLCAEVRLQPRTEHRALWVTWEYAAQPTHSDEPEPRNGATGNSAETIDGASARVTRTIKMSGLSGGTYEVVAVVVDEMNRVLGRASARVFVMN